MGREHLVWQIILVSAEQKQKKSLIIIKKNFPVFRNTWMIRSTLQGKHGYVETLMGRKRWLRDINSANFTVRGFAERNAINSPIQGTAADMIKLAMQKVHAAMKKEKMQSKMLLQVHDELVFDALKSEVKELKPLILRICNRLCYCHIMYR